MAETTELITRMTTMNEIEKTKPAPLATRRTVGDDLAHILEVGKAQGLDKPEQLEKLLDVYERIADRCARQQFNEALAAFQAECPPIEKRRPVFDSRGGLMYNYANLHDVLDVVRPLMVQHGLSVSWTVRPDETTPYVVCILKHVAGHFEGHAFPFGADAGAMTELQKRGSGLSYAKRYTLCEALGIDLDDDRDGQAPKDAVETIDEKEEQSLRDAVLELAPIGKDEAYISKFCGRFGVKKLSELPASRVDEAWEVVKKARTK